MIGPSPLLDFFRRREVARDVRLLAAQGALAPRAHEQLAILALLVEDPDREIRDVAEQTLGRIPREALERFLARSDVSIDLREFFADRGVFPDRTPALDEAASVPLVDSAPDDSEAGDPAAPQLTVAERIAAMGFVERLKAAVKGSREMRATLIRDPNRMIAVAVLSSPKLSDSEIEGFARMANVCEDVLRTIAATRAWTRQYGVVTGLAKNPKTSVAISLNLLVRLNPRDLSMLAVDRNVPEAVRMAARKRVHAGHKGS